MRTRTKSKTIMAAILIGAALVFLCVFWIYSRIISTNLIDESKIYLEEVTSKNAKTITNQMQSELNILESMASAISYESPVGVDELLNRIEANPISKKYKTVGIVDKSGDAYTKSNEVKNFKDMDWYNNAMLGTACISSQIESMFDGSLIYVYAVPIYIDNNITSVLFATKLATEFVNNYSYTFLDEQGKVYIVDQNLDNIMLPSTENPALKESSRLSFINENQKKAIRTAIPLHDSGVLYITKDSETSYYLGYTSLGLQQWYVFTLINSKSVNTNENIIKQVTFIFVAITSMLFLLLIWQLISHQGKDKEKARKFQLKLETVIANIPGGVVQFAYDDYLSIEFLNDGVLNLTGYTLQDTKTILKNSFLNAVHENDRQALASAIVDQMTSEKTVEIDCRLKCSNGLYSWFLFKGRMISQEGSEPSCLCVLTNINETKKAQQELNLSMQRYKIVTEQSDSIIFEYNYLDYTVYLSDKWNNKFTPLAKSEHFIDNAINNKLVYPDDVAIFESIFVGIKNGEKCKNIEIRLLTSAHKYIWCKIKASAVFDENGKVYKTVGKITDIDLQRRETEALKKKAERDSLSGLYNKGTTKMLIDDFFSNEGVGNLHAIMIIDIDNFKNINDSLGHLIGDSVISEVATIIKSLVRSSDICGRIGGDEFVVLLKNVCDLNTVQEKASEFSKAFRKTISNMGQSVDLSGSIGIAFYNKDGDNYTELIDKADTALYEAKKRGKDQFAIYGMNSEPPTLIES